MMYVCIFMMFSSIGSSLLSGLGLVPSGANNACQWPKWHPNGDVLVVSFHFLNRPFKSLVDMVGSMVGWGVLAISLRISCTSIGSLSMFGSSPRRRASVASESPSIPKMSVKA